MDKILVLDFGGQYDQLIARRIRAAHVYAEIKSYQAVSPAELRAAGYRGIVFTGGPHSVYAPEAPTCDAAILALGIPILGICYGHQLLAFLAGGKVAPSERGSEYGKTAVRADGHALFAEIPAESVCWMSHRDEVQALPAGFSVIARTEQCACAAFADDARKLYGVQFHPEVTHTEYGDRLLQNFLFRICGCAGDWRMADVAAAAVARCREALAGKRVLLALSGGVDSAVCTVLLQKAIGDRLTCVFVDHGLLRKGEGDLVERTFRGQFGIHLIRVNAQERFFAQLAGVTAPEQKRRIIGAEFIRVFEEEAKQLGRIDALAQGTIYPDVVESGKGDAAVIKSHHNVGGLPDAIVRRQPFPGPGLGVRIIGEVTAEKAAQLREADAIFREELDRLDPAQRPDQYFAVLTDTRSVGVMGDARTYGRTVALRAVTTDDFMTASWTRLPYEALERASSRITNEVPGVSRVVYDITSKPPATVEWE
ncbi:MAG: glutamine-hydrolyzing GMP synthase [Clostridia bacterium]|nr:glutamine-hydrolyzing GMP synthase [Clostridia bacterium]